VFAVRMHAPRSGSGDKSPFPCDSTPRNEKSRRGFPGRLRRNLSTVRA
jgi:hypothetical protein